MGEIFMRKIIRFIVQLPFRIMSVPIMAALFAAEWIGIFLVSIPIGHCYKASGKEHIYIKGGGRIEYRTRTGNLLGAVPSPCGALPLSRSWRFISAWTVIHLF